MTRNFIKKTGKSRALALIFILYILLRIKALIHDDVSVAQYFPSYFLDVGVNGFFHMPLSFFVSGLIFQLTGYYSLTPESKYLAFFILRFLSLLAGTVNFYLLYRLGKKYLSQNATCYALAIYAIAPIHILSSSTYLAPFEIVNVFVTICVYFLLRFFENRSYRDLAISSFSLTIAIFSYEVLAVFLGAVLVMMLMENARKKRGKKALARDFIFFSSIPLVSLALFFAADHIVCGGMFYHAITSLIKSVTASSTTPAYLKIAFSFMNFYVYGSLIFLVMVLSLVNLRPLLKSPEHSVFLVWGFFFFIVLFFIVSPGSQFKERYLSTVALPFSFLGGVLLESYLRNRSPNWIYLTIPVLVSFLYVNSVLDRLISFKDRGEIFQNVMSWSYVVFTDGNMNTISVSFPLMLLTLSTIPFFLLSYLVKDRRIIDRAFIIPLVFILSLNLMVDFEYNMRLTSYDFDVVGSEMMSYIEGENTSDPLIVTGFIEEDFFNNVRSGDQFFKAVNYTNKVYRFDLMNRERWHKLFKVNNQTSFVFMYNRKRIYSMENPLLIRIQECPKVDFTDRGEIIGTVYKCGKGHLDDFARELYKDQGETGS